MKVVIVGSGNVATIMGRTICESGAEILQIISKKEQHASHLANVLQASYTTNLLQINKSAELYLVAVGDQQIESVVEEIGRVDGLIVHTSGSVSSKVLKAASDRYGILYPLQTLNKQLENLPVIPVLVDGNSEEVRNELFTFANTFTPIVAYANDEKRLNTHLAAVIANNFTNHLIALTEDFCTKEGVDFKLLFPLIHETVSRLGDVSPSILQTGPAVRGDISTIDKHLQLLNRQPALKKLYLKLTESIIIQSKLNAID